MVRSDMNNLASMRAALCALAVLAALEVGCDEDPACGETPTPLPTAPLGSPPATTSFRLKIENVGRAYPFLSSGVFDTPAGAAAPAPAGPGAHYTFRFTAWPGARLSFSTMFVPSNDFFFAPGDAGIALYDPLGNPISGDVTSELKLWDAGTEVNQKPGEGPDQVQRQAAPNTGAPDPDKTVRAAPDTFGNLPSVASVIKLVITPGENHTFTVRLENVSSATTLAVTGGTQAVPFSPGAWVVHSAPGALFTVGQPDRGKGLADLAEDGKPTTLAAALVADTGVTVPLAPGAWAVHTSSEALFSAGQRDRGIGLEALAEDGDPGALASALSSQAHVASSGSFDTPVGSPMAGGAGPGKAYEVTLAAKPGDALSFATMFVASNDLFFAPNPGGIALFNGTTPVSGDVTAQVRLWDAGTEHNQEPGAGSNQPMRQAAPNTGPAEHGKVRRVEDVEDGFVYPAAPAIIRVTLTPL